MHWEDLLSYFRQPPRTLVNLTPRVAWSKQPKHNSTEAKRGVLKEQCHLFSSKVTFYGIMSSKLLFYGWGVFWCFEWIQINLRRPGAGHTLWAALRGEGQSCFPLSSLLQRHSCAAPDHCQVLYGEATLTPSALPLALVLAQTSFQGVRAVVRSWSPLFPPESSPLLETAGTLETALLYVRCSKTETSTG